MTASSGVIVNRSYTQFDTYRMPSRSWNRAFFAESGTMSSRRRAHPAFAVIRRITWSRVTWRPPERSATLNASCDSSIAERKSWVVR